VARDEREGDIEDVCDLLRRHSQNKNHVVLEIHLRFGRPVGVVKETRTTLVGEIKSKRLKNKIQSEKPHDAAPGTTSQE